MTRTPLFLLCLLVAVAPLPAAAGTIMTLGVLQSWDEAEVAEHFLRAGVGPQPVGEKFSPPEVSGEIRRTVSALEDMVKHEGAKNAWASALKDIDLAEMDFTELRFGLECQYWENGIERRDDVAFVAVCFGQAEDASGTVGVGEKLQVALVPFFRSGQVARHTVQEYLTEEYGKPLEDVPDWWIAKFMGVLPAKYILCRSCRKHSARNMPYRRWLSISTQKHWKTSKAIRRR